MEIDDPGPIVIGLMEYNFGCKGWVRSECIFPSLEFVKAYPDTPTTTLGITFSITLLYSLYFFTWELSWAEYIFRDNIK
jgi:hypothetical protein